MDGGGNIGNVVDLLAAQDMQPAAIAVAMNGVTVREGVGDWEVQAMVRFSDEHLVSSGGGERYNERNVA